MTIEFNGSTFETTANGHLENPEEWSEDLARHMASQSGVELGDAHWDVLKYLRDEYFNNNQSQPNTRAIVKAMADAWGRDVDQTELYDLFGGDPSKEGGRIAGLPESRRKGGY